MTESALSAETDCAIARCVRSPEELEVLLFLSRSSRRYCSPQLVATETGLPASTVSGTLDALASRNLLDVRLAEAVLYKLDPSSAELQACVALTVAAGRTNRSAVLKVILSRSPEAGDVDDPSALARSRQCNG